MRTVLILAFFATQAFAQKNDAEVITRGFNFSENSGIMVVSGEVKNNTNHDFKHFSVKIEFLHGIKVVDALRIQVGDTIAVDEQVTIKTRTESVTARWNDYRMSFYEDTTPLFWRLPKN